MFLYGYYLLILIIYNFIVDLYLSLSCAKYVYLAALNFKVSLFIFYIYNLKRMTVICIKIPELNYPKATARYFIVFQILSCSKYL